MRIASDIEFGAGIAGANAYIAAADIGIATDMKPGEGIADANTHVAIHRQPRGNMRSAVNIEPGGGSGCADAQLTADVGIATDIEFGGGIAGANPQIAGYRQVMVIADKYAIALAGLAVKQAQHGVVAVKSTAATDSGAAIVDSERGTVAVGDPTTLGCVVMMHLGGSNIAHVIGAVDSAAVATGVVIDDFAVEAALLAVVEIKGAAIGGGG